MNSMNRHGAAAGELSWHDSTSGAIVRGLPHSFCGPSPFLVESHRRCKAPLQHWRVSFHSHKLKLKLPTAASAPGAGTAATDACRRFSPSLLCGRSMMRVESKVLRCGCRHCPRDSWNRSESWKWRRGSRRSHFLGPFKMGHRNRSKSVFCSRHCPMSYIYIYYTNCCFFSDFRHGHHDISWHIMTASNSSTKQT